MRLTLILCKFHMGRMIKRHWFVQGNRKIIELPVPPQLVEKGVKIYDPIEDKKPKEEPKPEYFPNFRWIKKEERVLRFDLPEPYTDDKTLAENEIHPLWNDAVVYECHEKVRMLQGDEQALFLTKTLKYDGLPSQVSSLVGQFSAPNQDAMVQQHAKLALLWDCIQRKLPKVRKFPELHKSVMREYGIPAKRKVTNLINQMVIASEKVAGNLEGSLDRTKLENPSCRTFIKREHATIFFKSKANLLLTAKEPLPPFASPEEVAQTIEVEVPDIHPLGFTLNLPQKNIYMAGEEAVISPEARNNNLHTIYVGHNVHVHWHPPQKLARAIHTCFGFTAAQARQKYGMDVKELPEPICVQCVYNDVQNFGFLGYQLNTVDIESSTGKKNQVWVDGPYQLYEECSEKTGMTGYSPEVFDKLLALYAYGLKPAL